MSHYSQVNTTHIFVEAHNAFKNHISPFYNIWCMEVWFKSFQTI